MTTKKYLNSIYPPQKGDFVEKTTGKVLGHHEGFWQYTIGQRKGIGLAAPQPLYVIGIEPEKNIVYVGYKNELEADGVELKDFCWSYPVDSKEFDCLVKIRYNMKSVKARVNCDNGFSVEFLEPTSGITQGQACVLYDINDGHLLGGSFL